MLTQEHWDRYAREGYLHLGRLLTPDQVEALKQRADDLALGRVVNPGIGMQLDTGGAYEALPGAVDHFEQPTLLYRKIQGLETDEVFSPLVRHPLILEICAHEYGAHAPVSLFRAMVMNKPAGQGTYLPWHQDGGDVWKLDRDPLVTVWVALDPATRANGCMEIVPGTHRLGLLSREGSNISAENAARYCTPDVVMPLEVEAGHGVLIHNWLLHRSGVNPSEVPRRAFTGCYLDGRTLNVLTGTHFPLVAGEPPERHPYVVQYDIDAANLRQAQATAAAYAQGLEAQVEGCREAYARLETSARAHIDNLERELARLRAPVA